MYVANTTGLKDIAENSRTPPCTVTTIILKRAQEVPLRHKTGDKKKYIKYKNSLNSPKVKSLLEMKFRISWQNNLANSVKRDAATLGKKKNVSDKAITAL